MKLVVLIVLGYVTATSAQYLGAMGSKMGSRVGADIGLLTGTALDTLPSMMGMTSGNTEPPPKRAGQPLRARGRVRNPAKAVERGSNDALQESNDTEKKRERGKGPGRGRPGGRINSNQ